MSPGYGSDNSGHLFCPYISAPLYGCHIHTLTSSSEMTIVTFSNGIWQPFFCLYLLNVTI